MIRSRHLPRLIPLAAAILVFAGCYGVPANALKLAPDSARNRDMQTRRYENTSEEELLAACAGVVQDLGFNLDDSESRLGLIAASRNLTSRQQVEGGKAVQMVAVSAVVPILAPSALYFLIAGIKQPQTVRFSLVTSPGEPGSSRSATVRLTAQRIIYNNEKHSQVVLVEPLNDPEFYREFFTRLSRSAFLEKQGNAP